MRKMRRMCAALLCCVLCFCSSGVFAETDRRSAEEIKSLSAMISSSLMEYGYEHFELVFHPATGMISVDIAVDGVMQMMASGAVSELTEIRTAFEASCHSLIDLLEKQDQTEFKRKVFYRLMNDDLFIRGDDSSESVVLLCIYNGQSLIDEIPVESGQTMPMPSEEQQVSYSLNIRSKKFHIPTCESVGRTKEENKRDFTGKREEIVSLGYAPCGSCNP